MTEQPDDLGTSPETASTPDASAADAPRGGIADAIFAEVEQMTASGAMSKSDAFETIATRTGRRPGTVMANYYRIARKRGTALAPRTRRGPGRPTSAGARAVGDAEAVIGRLEDAVKDLAGLLRTQEAELARLRERADQFDELKAIIARNG